MAYTPELSLEASCTLRRLAWSWKMPMTKAIEKVFLDIAHVYDRERICALCRDITRCKECAFQTKRIKEMKTIICDLCKENEGLTFPVQINCKVGPIGKENHFDYADICLDPNQAKIE